MALNEIYKDASQLVFPVHASVKSGDFVQVGNIVGVAQNDAVTGEDGSTYATLMLEGAHIIAFAPNQTFQVGQKAYAFAETTGIIDDVAEDSMGKLVGHVIKVTTNSVVVRLAQN